MTKIVSNSKQYYLIISVIGILVSIFISYNMRWLGDDIFIALRYVKNFNAGNGLVYNVGERVEGYTDFLWLILISVFTYFKCDAAKTSEVLGILFSTGTLIIFSVIEYKISLSKNKFIIPFVTLALVLNYDYYVWATSGLEVSFVTFLLSAAFYIYFFKELPANKRLVFTGLFICLGLLTRPDVMIILISANLFLFIGSLLKRERFIRIIKIHSLFNLAILAIYFPYFLWRYNYYGFIFPNTYYDKLGNESAFAKGFYYIWLYFKCHFTSFLILIPFFSFFPFIIKNGFKKVLLQKKFIPLITAISFVFIYLIVFVAKVGGDFMFARFIIPCVPFIYFIIIYFLTLIDVKHLNMVLLCILSLCIIESVIRVNLFVETSENGKERAIEQGGIADERYVYLHLVNAEDETNMGKELNECLKGINFKAMVMGAQARFAYYADFSYSQEYYGLTDTFIAHSEIKERGRIGHEKHATIEYLAAKGIHFAFNAGALKDDEYRLATIQLPSRIINIEIITYDNEIIDKVVTKLGKKFQYVNFPDYLDSYINSILPTIKSYDELDNDYKKFYSYYFKNNDDKKREDIILIALKKLKWNG